MEMGTVVLILTVLAILAGIVLLIKGAFWLVDELHKERPQKSIANVQRKQQKVVIPDVDHATWEAALKLKPVLGESTQRKPRRKLAVPPPGSQIKGMPGKRKLDI